MFADQQKYLHLCLSLFIAVFCARCTYDSTPPIRVGVSNWLGYAPLYFTGDADSQRNASFRTLLMTSSEDVVHGLRTGTIEAAGLALDEAILLASEGLPLDIILVLDKTHNAEALLSKSAHNNILDLKQKTVVLENSTTGFLILHAALQQSNLSLNDINIVFCNFEQHKYCIDEADAIVTYEPMKSHLLADGATLLFDSQDITTRMVDVLVVRSEILKTRRKSVELLVSHYYKTLSNFQRNTDEFNSRLASLSGLNQTRIAESIQSLEFVDQEESKTLLTGSPSLIDLQIQKLTSLMCDAMLIDPDQKITLHQVLLQAEGSSL